MGLVKYSPLVSEVRGKVGDVIFSRNTYGAYVRDYVIPLNPNTTYQQTARNLMSAAVILWQGLSEDQRTQWRAYASELIRTNRYNDLSRLSGYNAFIMQAINRSRMSLSPLSVPNGFNRPEQYKAVSFKADTTLGLYTLQWSPNIALSDRLFVYATPGLSPGINFVKAEFRYLTSYSSFAGGSANIASVYSSRFGGLASVGSKVFIKVKGVYIASGLEGVETKIFDIAV